MNASAPSCKHDRAALANFRSDLKSWAMVRTRRWNGSFLIRRSVDFWYLRISRSATVPGRKRCGFFIDGPVGTAFRAALLATICFRGALPPLLFRAVCFVRAIVDSRGAEIKRGES